MWSKYKGWNNEFTEHRPRQLRNEIVLRMNYLEEEEEEMERVKDKAENESGSINLSGFSCFPGKWYT